ncbi:MAG: hypothetical protein L3J17_15045 [Candidatus Jettenia sp.]|nr:MAG: hypothetical protein L3J17_15045 [Candidatus Jettenia sp.]
MLDSISFSNARLIINIQKKAEELITAVLNFKKKHRSFLMNCAVIYMSLKIGIILIATFSVMALLISHMTQHLAVEMSKPKVLLLVSPLTLIIMLKLYFIFKILITYDRSRLIIKFAINGVLCKSKQGVRRIERALQVGLLPLSLEKAENH